MYEVILTFGFMTTSTVMTVVRVILAATAGSTAGAICLYGVGRMLPVERLERIIATYGKNVRRPGFPFPRVSSVILHRWIAYKQAQGIVRVLCLLPPRQLPPTTVCLGPTGP